MNRKDFYGDGNGLKLNYDDSLTTFKFTKKSLNCILKMGVFICKLYLDKAVRKIR